MRGHTLLRAPVIVCKWREKNGRILHCFACDEAELKEEASCQDSQDARRMSECVRVSECERACVRAWVCLCVHAPVYEVCLQFFFSLSGFW